MQTLTVTTSDQHYFDLRLFAAKNPRAVFLLAPAMGISATYYDGFAQALAAKNVSVAVMDLRGQGSSNLRASRDVDWGYARMIEVDFFAAMAAVKVEWPELPLYLFGHSQGGHLALLLLAHRPHDVAGVITMACGGTYYRGWPFPESLKILAQTQAVRLPVSTLGYFPGERLGFGGLQARTEMLDWSNAGISGRYDLIGAAIDYEAGMKTATQPAWLFSLEGDAFTPSGAAAFLAKKVAGAQHRHLSAAELPPAARDHFRWTRHPEAILPPVFAALGWS